MHTTSQNEWRLFDLVVGVWSSFGRLSILTSTGEGRSWEAGWSGERAEWMSLELISLMPPCKP